MTKLILATLLLAFSVAAAFRSTTTEEISQSSQLTPMKVSAKQWVELDDGSKSGTKVSVDLSSFEVITPEDVFEFIVMLEFTEPKHAEGELIVATLASIQISCKQKVAATVRDLSINVEQQNVLPNMVSKAFGVKPLEQGSHFGNIASYVCTRGGTLDPSLKSEPKSNEKPQAERDA